MKNRKSAESFKKSCGTQAAPPSTPEQNRRAIMIEMTTPSAIIEEPKKLRALP
jgi:hypothetical protein